MFEFLTHPVFIISVTIYLLIGGWLFKSWFVMGLMGCTSKRDLPFAITYTIGAITLWPGFIIWSMT